MKRISVRLPAALLYLFILVLVYLAGVYVSRLYYFIYFVMMIVPICSVVQLVVTYPSLAIVEELDSTKPTKGQTIRFRVAIHNRSALPTGRISITFAAPRTELDERPSPVTLSLLGRRAFEHVITLRLSYRGLYTIGIESLVVSDLLGWVRIRLPVRLQTICVYPRILDVAPSYLTGSAPESSAQVSVGRDGDLSLFEGLAGYRSGFPAKQIAWKKYLATGIPFLKEYGSAHHPGTTIYLDLRRSGGVSSALLAAEDCSVEILVALVRDLLGKHIATTVRLSGSEEATFRGSSLETFDELYRIAAYAQFAGAVSPSTLFMSDRAGGAATEGVVFLTHLVDRPLLDLLASDSGEAAGAIVIRSALGNEQRAELERYALRASDQRRNLLFVDDLDGIKEVGRR